MKRRIRILLGAGLLVLVVLIALAVRPRPVPVDLGEARSGPLTVTVEEDAITRVSDRYLVSAPIAGNLQRIELDPGDPVEPGAVVARIAPATAALLDPRTRAEAEARLRAAEQAARGAASAVRRAEARQAFAATEVKRLEALAKAGGVAERDLDAARLEAESAERELESARFAANVARFEERMARATLAGGEGGGDSLELRAPAAGRVLRIENESGGFVGPGTPLLEIGDPRSLELVADLLSEDAVEVDAGDWVIVRRWGGERPLAGTVRRVEPSAFTKVSALGVEEQRVNVVIDLVDPPEARPNLGDRFGVDVEIVVAEVPDALIVPAGALFRRGEAWAVYAVEGGEVRLREVEVGRRSGLAVQVTGGLEAGDVVVVHPPDRVTEGTPVVAR